MPGFSAVIFVPDDTAKTGSPLPMLSILGAPLLSWLSHSLYDSGIGRFFLVCHERYAAEALACLPAEAEVMTAASNHPADLLHVFLSTADESEREITIVTGAAVYAPTLAAQEGTPKRSCVCRAPRMELMAALDENFSFLHFMREKCEFLSDFDGFFSIDSPAAALTLAKVLHREQMLRLQKQGVEIFDAENCYIAPTVRVEAGAKLLAGTILRGNSVIRAGAVIGPWSVVEDSEIGEDCTVNCSQVYGSKLAAGCAVGPFAHIRPHSDLERGVKLGNFVEVKNTHIGENTWASHLSYLGDADIGARCNLGCGTSTVNFDRVEKYRTEIADDAFIGCHSSLIAPLKIGQGAYIAAGSAITEDVPANALGIARARQSNKKDWSLKHKRPKEK